MPGQSHGSSCSLGEPAAERDQRLGNLVVGATDGVLFDQRGRGLAERAGVDLLRDQLDAALVVELDGDADPAAAGRRAQLRAAVLAIERARLAERCGESRRISVV